MSAKSTYALYEAGKLDEAIQALGVALRDNPADVQSRTFLFELLCFTGDYERAAKHLNILAGAGKEAELGAMLYRGALIGERTRQELFRDHAPPDGGKRPRPVRGTLNGRPFRSLTDADPRIGARLEVIAAGQYLWLPLEHVESVRVQPPQRLRDLCWANAMIRTSPALGEQELGEVLLPVLTPLAWQHPDVQVRLGRATEWQMLEDGREIPMGQKLLVADGEEIPILEVRELVISSP